MVTDTASNMVKAFKLPGYKHDKEEEHTSVYPSLAEIAKTVLGIPASLERLFSIGGKVLGLKGANLLMLHFLD